jgi:hypothetical protein
VARECATTVARWIETAPARAEAAKG